MAQLVTAVPAMLLIDLFFVIVLFLLEGSCLTTSRHRFDQHLLHDLRGKPLLLNFKKMLGIGENKIFC